MFSISCCDIFPDFFTQIILEYICERVKKIFLGMKGKLSQRNLQKDPRWSKTMEIKKETKIRL